MLLHTVKQSISPKRVVILGATGVIGKALVSYLKDRGEIVVEIGSRDLDLPRDDAPERLAGRLLSDDADGCSCRHCAETGRDQATMAKNAQMGRHIFAALTRRPVAHVLYMSSDAVYPRSMEDVSRIQPDGAFRSLFGHASRAGASIPRDCALSRGYAAIHAGLCSTRYTRRVWPLPVHPDGEAGEPDRAVWTRRGNPRPYYG